jgi:hypothetical protein
MSRPDKQTVGLTTARRPSRIRRDPVRAEEPKTLAGKGDFNSREREIALGIVGIVAFALALNVIWLGLSAWMGK